MIGYRFLRSEYLEQLLAGTFRFGSLRYYRILEAATKDQWIGDVNEGITRGLLDGIALKTGEDRDMRDRLARAGILGGGGGVTFEGTTFVRELNGFVFCVSHGILSDLRHTMMSAAGSAFSYDSCVKIISLRLLAQELFAHGRLATDNTPISELFHLPLVQAVIYEDNTVDLRQRDAIPGSFFRKDPRYETQQETRIALSPMRPLDEDFITITCPSAAQFLQVEFRGTNRVPDALVREDSRIALSNLLQILARIDHDRDAMWSDTLGRTASTDEERRAMEQALTERMNAEALGFESAYRDEITRNYWIVRQSGHRHQGIDRALCGSINGGVISGLVADLRNLLREAGALDDGIGIG